MLDPCLCCAVVGCSGCLVATITVWHQQEQVVDDGDGTAEVDPSSRRCTAPESPEVGTATTTRSGCGGSVVLRPIDPGQNAATWGETTVESEMGINVQTHEFDRAETCRARERHRPCAC
jgi:hypothetical protein